MSGSPLIYASVAFFLSSLSISSFRDELGAVDSLSTLGFFNNVLVERGWLLGQMQFKYWVPQPRLFNSGLKILPSNFSKKTTAEFDFGFHSIYALSFLLLHIVFNFQ